ncbi:MAG: hypothetical protein PVSMB7_26550 [Chloroflexota bacterium]
MDSLPMDEVIELDDSRLIQLSFDRVWPRYVVNWSIRQPAGESDFPIATGAVDALPPPEGAIDALWDRLRSEATAEARAAIPAHVPDQQRSFLSKIFGKR